MMSGLTVIASMAVAAVVTPLALTAIDGWGWWRRPHRDDDAVRSGRERMTW